MPVVLESSVGMVVHAAYWKIIHSPAHVHRTIVDNFVTITLVATVQTVSTTSSMNNMIGISLVDAGQSIGLITVNNIILVISGASIGFVILVFLIIAFLIVVVVVVVKRKRRHHTPLGT